MHGFQVQQSRWAKGLTQVAKKLLPAILQGRSPEADEGRSVSAPHAEHLVPADDRGLGADAAGDDRALLHGLVQMVFLDLPLIAASFWSISLFYVIAQRELYPKTWKRTDPDAARC